MAEQPQIEKDMRKITQEELTVKADSIYEAIMVVAKRARQIRRTNKKDFEEIKKELQEESTDIDRSYFKEEKVELPKYERPERVAIHELLEDKLNYEYVDIAKANQ